MFCCVGWMPKCIHVWVHTQPPTHPRTDNTAVYSSTLSVHVIHPGEDFSFLQSFPAFCPFILSSHLLLSGRKDLLLFSGRPSAGVKLLTKL